MPLDPFAPCVPLLLLFELLETELLEPVVFIERRACVPDIPLVDAAASEVFAFIDPALFPPVGSAAPVGPPLVCTPFPAPAPPAPPPAPCACTAPTAEIRQVVIAAATSGK
jgi:hypothetical protein